MASLKGTRKTAVALFVDGLEVKLARLTLKKGRVVLDELRSATLVSKLEERKLGEVALEAPTPAEGEFAVPTGEPLAEVSGGEDNNAVLLGLLSPYTSSKYVFSYGISEPSIYYQAFESDFGLKGKKLKTRIIEELQTTRTTAPLPDAVDWFPSADGGLMSVVRENGISLYNLMEGIKPFIGNRLPRFALMESADAALMGLARANYGFTPEEITVIIYVGVEFTRLIFMKGSDFFHFAPVIGEGFEATNIQNTIYARLLLEQDGLGIPRVNRVLIAGEARRLGFDEFLRGQLPDVDVQYLNTPYLDTTQVPLEIQEQVPEYAIAIGTAWKILQERHPAFYTTNLLPESVREGQRVFKLAWHGLLLLGLLFVATFFFTARITDLGERIKLREGELTRKQSQAKVNDELRATIDGMNAQLNQYDAALSVYNAIVPGYDRWSSVVAKIDSGFQILSSVWITELNAREEGIMAITGFTLYKARIPRVASLFDKTTLKTVEVEEIREKTAYRFKIEVELPKAQKK